MRIHKSERPYKCNVEGCEKVIFSISFLFSLLFLQVN